MDFYREFFQQMRNRLVALHPQNYANLEEIQKSVFIVALDDESPTDESDVSEQCLTLLHSERPKLYTILAFLSAIGLMEFRACFSKVTIKL